MTDAPRRFGTLLVAAALVWHVLSVLTPAWVLTADTGQARDFGTYYYAARVASDGGDPYDRASLNQAARDQSTRKGVHPFLYAPPFLLAVSWTPRFDLSTAFKIWFWLDELLAIAAALVLWRWWRPFGAEIAPVLALVVATMTAIPNNHAMGQANFPGLLLALAGLWQVERGQKGLGGALMGAACMLKMSPALLVFWWLIRREWVAAGAAIAAGVALSIATLPLAGVDVQWRFYTEILPMFSSGSYNGLAVPIEMFGNHSVPALLHDLFPSGAHRLSGTASALSSVFNLAALATLAFLYRDPGPTPFARSAQAASFGVLLLLFPVFTYEHHLVFALPAAVLAVFSVVRGQLAPGWTVAIGLAVGVLLFDLQSLKGIAENVPSGISVVSAGLRELKPAALGVLLVVTTLLGARKETA